jgi:hypothetical protein
MPVALLKMRVLSGTPAFYKQQQLAVRLFDVSGLFQFFFFLESKHNPDDALVWKSSS